MRIIAVDFDGCLCEAKWPEIGAPRQQVINELVRAQVDGAKLILWTCRQDEQLEAALEWCFNHGLRFDAVNDNLPENIERYGNNSRKVWATEYWDDKNVLVVSSGAATSIAFAGSEGGMTIKRWETRGVHVVPPPPWRPRKKKKWWQIWR